MQTRQILCCSVLLLCMSLSLKGQEYILERLNPAISTDQYDEISPCVSKDGQTLYFTRIGFPEFEPTLVENGQNLKEHAAHEHYLRRLSEIYSQLAGRAVANPQKSAFNQDIWIAHSTHNTFDLIETSGLSL